MYGKLKCFIYLVLLAELALGAPTTTLSTKAASVFSPNAVINQTHTETPEDKETVSSLSVAKNGTLTNYAQHDKKLLVSGGGLSSEKKLSKSDVSDGLQITRSISNTSQSNAASSSAGLSLTLLLVLLVLITLVISIILGAVFVMRRRFTVWRLSGNNGNDACDGAAEAAKTDAEKCEAAENIQANEVEATNETNDKDLKEKSEESVEHSDKKTQEDNQTSNGEQQPSPATSETRLLESGDEKTAAADTADAEQVVAKTEETMQTTVPNTTSTTTTTTNNPSTNPTVTETTNEQATSDNPAKLNGNVSSTSLIANVLNEITDTVTSKMSIKSGSKSALDQPAESDKEPLNQ